MGKVSAIGSLTRSAPLTFNPVTTPVVIKPSQVKPAPVVQPTGLFSAKDGGTLVGNILRGVVNQATDGHFGNGVMQKQAGETDQQYQARLLQAFGAGAEQFNNTAKNSSNSTNMADSFKSGVTQAAITNAIKTYAPTVILVGVGIFVVKKFILKKGGGSRRRSY